MRNFLTLLILSVLTFLTACQQPPQEQRLTVEYYNSPVNAARNVPYSEAVKVGQTLYLAGKLGMKDGKLAEGGIQGETKQAMENIQAVLSQYGASMDDIVKVTVFLADMGEWGAMNEVYKTFFVDHFPARSAVGVDSLARGARLEIECIAVLPQTK
ncbi:MAG: Rid family detoxifying hydrolase [Bacteroidota bacterium]